MAFIIYVLYRWLHGILIEFFPSACCVCVWFPGMCVVCSMLYDCCLPVCLLAAPFHRRSMHYYLLFSCSSCANSNLNYLQSAVGILSIKQTRFGLAECLSFRPWTHHRARLSMLFHSCMLSLSPKTATIPHSPSLVVTVSPITHGRTHPHLGEKTNKNAINASCSCSEDSLGSKNFTALRIFQYFRRRCRMEMWKIRVIVEQNGGWERGTLVCQQTLGCGNATWIVATDLLAGF